MHEAIATFGRSGIDYIVDGSLPTDPELRDRCLAILRDVSDTRVIAVHCSAEQLRERERSRPDRARGWAEEQLGLVYGGVDFDGAVDTTTTTPEDAAEQPLQELFGAEASDS
jgi:chloramphenicol 3-O phosphotransferase